LGHFVHSGRHCIAEDADKGRENTPGLRRKGKSFRLSRAGQAAGEVVGTGEFMKFEEFFS
jgi:hypothetical protein